MVWVPWGAAKTSPVLLFAWIHWPSEKQVVVKPQGQQYAAIGQSKDTARTPVAFKLLQFWACSSPEDQ